MLYLNRYWSFAIFILLILFTSCSTSTEESTIIKKGTESDESKVNSANKKAAPNRLDESNAAEFLEDYGKDHPEKNVILETPKGEVKIRLYENTPYHRANFLYLTNQKYFDDTWFYRVSKGHVIQAGNTDGMETVKKRKKVGDYKIPAEMIATNCHKYGAVAMARSYHQNPEKKSDAYEFYIVLGKSYTRRELELLAEKHEMIFTDAQLDFYSQTKGSPHLDGQHTVFGEVIAGMDVVEAISNVEVDEGEWPMVNLPIKVKIIR